MQSTIVQVRCVSKKETLSYNPERPIATAIELDVPYDPNSIFYKLSGGTSIMLNTINEDAASMFVTGEMFNMVISTIPPAPQP